MQSCISQNINIVPVHKESNIEFGKLLFILRSEVHSLVVPVWNATRRSEQGTLGWMTKQLPAGWAISYIWIPPTLICQTRAQEFYQDLWKQTLLINNRNYLKLKHKKLLKCVIIAIRYLPSYPCWANKSYQHGQRSVLRILTYHSGTFDNFEEAERLPL